MPAELVVGDREAPLIPPVVGLALARCAGTLEVAERVVGDPAEREGLWILRVQCEGVPEHADGLLILTTEVEHSPEKAVAVTVQRVQYDRSAQGSKARLGAANYEGEVAVELQHPCIARRERERALVLFIRPREIQRSDLEIEGQRRVPLGQIRRQRNGLQCIGLRLVEAPANVRSRSLTGILTERDRSVGVRERIVRIKSDRLRVGGDRSLSIRVPVRCKVSLPAPQVRIEGRGVTRPAQLDLRRLLSERLTLRALATAPAISVSSFSTSPKSRS